MVLAFGIWCYDTLAPWWSSEKTGREGYWRSTVVRGIREKWGIPQKTLTQSSAGTRESSWTQWASKHNRFSFWDGTDSTKLHIPVSQRDLQLSFWGVVWCGSSRTCCSSMETHSSLICSAESSISLLACDPYSHLSCFKIHDEINLTFHTQV